MPDYTLEVHPSVHAIDHAAWDALLARQAHPSPFMRHAYLAALQDSGSATSRTGWAARYFALWQGDVLAAACVLYLKAHSRGEYVFDWAWADAYARHGLTYYPKAVVAVPFTPVPGTRLLARDGEARQMLLQQLITWCREQHLSSLHLLFAAEEDIASARQAGLMLRHTVQFHWHNRHPQQHKPFSDFDDFLMSLSQGKRKKIRQERRRVADAGVRFRVCRGTEISAADWDFFYACYDRTYWEHGNPPYLTRDFFARTAHQMPELWLLFIAERDGHPVASSLIAIGAEPSSDKNEFGMQTVAYGRYWGALERVDCLHFDACYYQPIAWCIANGVARFEGGAQGEHKLARALLPTQATSAHWLAHPGFAHAVDEYLQREREGMEHYMDQLQAHNPFRHEA